LDLHTAVERYEQVRHFWAREITIILGRGWSGSLVALLRVLSLHDSPMSANRLLDALPSAYRTQHSRDTTGSNHLLQLFRSGLITRTRRGHTYWYVLTELGALVLMYTPEHQEIHEKKNTPEHQEIHEKKNTPEHQEIHEKKKRGRPRKTPALAAQSG
jgi:hypothetical protein